MNGAGQGEGATCTLSPAEAREIEERLVAAEQEIRALRITLQLVTACSCPVGWGSQPNPSCPKHGSHATDA